MNKWSSTPLGGREASSKPLSSNRKLASVIENSKEHGCFLTGFTLKRMSSNYGLVTGPSLFLTVLCQVGLTLFLIQSDTLPDLSTSRMPPSAISLQPEMCPWLALSAFPLPITTLTPALLVYSAVIYLLGSLPPSCPIMPHCPSPPTFSFPFPSPWLYLPPRFPAPEYFLWSKFTRQNTPCHWIPPSNTNHPSYLWALAWIQSLSSTIPQGRQATWPCASHPSDIDRSSILSSPG